MTTDTQFNALWYLLLLILPLSALFARRLPIGQTVKLALAWAAIFAIALIVATFWVRNRASVDGFLADAGLTGNMVSGRTVVLQRGDGGHFTATVSINGVTRRMMIDTGATNTTLSQATAAAAGVTSDDQFGVLVDTANGTVVNRRATVDRLTLGSINARHFPVLINAGSDVDLIGMDFLSSLKNWRAEGNRLILEPRDTKPGI